jgi:hypothetical protein
VLVVPAPCAREAPHLAEVLASLKDTRKHVRHRWAPVSFQSRPVGPRGAHVVGSLFLPTVASTAAEPGDNSRQVRTAADHRSSTRPMPDNLDGVPIPTDQVLPETELGRSSNAIGLICALPETCERDLTG